MTLFFLDTNVLTEGWKKQPDPALERWIETNDWLIPVPVIAEITGANRGTRELLPKNEGNEEAGPGRNSQNHGLDRIIERKEGGFCRREQRSTFSCKKSIQRGRFHLDDSVLFHDSVFA